MLRPFGVTVTPGRACAPRCVARGLERQVAPGEVRTFVIEARDQFGNACALGGETYQVAVAPRGHGHHGSVLGVDDHCDGRYTVAYSTPASGKYALCAKLGKEDVSGTPFVLVAAAGPATPRLASPHRAVASGGGDSPQYPSTPPPRSSPPLSPSSRLYMSPSARQLFHSGGPSPTARLAWDRSAEPPLAWELDMAAELSPSQRARGTAVRPAWVD